MSSTLTTSSTLLSQRDLRFLLEEWLEIGSLTERCRYTDQSLEEYRDILRLAEQLAAVKFAPHNREADRVEPQLKAGSVVLLEEVKQALDAFAEAGFLGATLAHTVGGMQLPVVVGSASFAWFCAANVGTANYAFLTMTAARMLIRHGSPEQVERWVRPMVEGRYLGTMCLSEPQAGSSLADILTRAEPQADGSYRLVGTKMWISGGDHELSENIVHLVLAKIPGGPAGVKGISLFIVPRLLVDDAGQPLRRNDVVLSGVNHKMGQRGTVNTVLNFGEGVHSAGPKRGAVGYLIGLPHRGLAYMFDMMNEARILTGLAAAALGYTAYLKACRYARERPQGRPLGVRAPIRGQVPIIKHADVKRMLLAQKSFVEGSLALVLYCARLADDAESDESAEARSRAKLLLDLLTPIAKSWPSLWCLEANSLAIQVHGGYGYSRDYDVEQHYRDNRLNLIHEGTHGIQALDLLGRKAPMNEGAAASALFEEVDRTVREGRALGGQMAAFADMLGAYVSRLREVTAILNAERDRALALANATIYLEVCGHLVVAWLWLQQFILAADREGVFYAGKRQAARYFFRYELPRIGPQLDLLAALDRTTLEMEADWF